MENQKEKEDKNINDILNQEFFDTIKLSKKINSKGQKINELTDYFKKNPNYNELPEIKNKIEDLLNLLLTNLNENNNNYVLAQMELIKTLSKTLNKEENFKNFIKSSLPKLFDKFYLGNTKINDTLIEMFNDFISFKILSIKDYFQYIENIPLEEEDNYRINIINFLYEQINIDKSVLLSNIPKSINELIKKLVNDNESDISETASKILNILINRDIKSNKKKDQDVNQEKDKDKVINNKDIKENKDDKNNEEFKGKKSSEIFVKNIVTAIKKESKNNESQNIINKDEKKEEIKNENIENKKNENEENKNNDNKIEKENESLKNNNFSKEEKKEEEKKDNEKEIKVENKLNDEKKENNKEEIKNEKIEEQLNNKKEEKKVEDKTSNENKLEEKIEQKPPEEKKEEQNKKEEKSEIKKDNENIVSEPPKEDEKAKVEEKKEIEIKGSSDSNTLNDNNDKKNEENEENKEEKKEEKTKLKKGGVGAKRTGIKSQISKFRKNLAKNKKKGDAFEFELVEKKKDGNIEKNTIIPEEKEKDSNNKEEIKESPKEEKIPDKNENIQEMDKKEDNKMEQNIKKEEIKIEVKEKETPKELKIPKEQKKEEPKKEEPKKEEPKKEEPKKEEPKKEEPKKIKPKKEEPKKLKAKKEETKKVEPKKEIKEDKKEDESLNIKENIGQDEQMKEQSESNSISIAELNQQSLNEFERKLQLALEQEEKGINNNSNENLGNNAPIKQKNEDPKFDEIKSLLGKEIIDSLFSPKWEVKKKGFELINEFVNNKPNNSYNVNDLIEYMKLKLKNYKETNFNINREAINIYNNMIKKKIITKDLLAPIIIAYHEKLGDIKLKDNIIELITNSFDIIEPNSILKQIISKISKKNNAKLLIEYATFLGNIVEEYDVKDLPNKEIIDYCKVLANNSNPQVRTAAISLLCILYKYLGKDVKTLTRDIKESTLKLIDAELDKVQVIDPKESTGKKKKIASTAGDGKASSGGGGDLIPPQDISKKITAKIIKDLSGKWAEKKGACESIEKILNAANMRILPNGLNNIMTTFKKSLSDSNKNFVKMIVSLLSKFIEALKQNFKQWAKPIAQALIPNLADKNQLMRNECQNCFDKWVEFCGFDSLAIYFPPFLKTDNTEMRIEIMNFFIRHKDKFNKSTGELVYKDMMNPLLICLQDRLSNVRNAAEEIIKSSLNFIPISNYYKKSEDFKPAITKTLKQTLDKIKRETENAIPQENNNTSEQENNQQQQQANTEPNNINNNKSSENSNTLNSKKNLTQIPKKNEENSNTKSNTSKNNTSKKNSIQLSEQPLKTEPDNNDDNNNMDEQMNNYNTTNFSKTTKKIEKDSTKKNTTKINVKRAKPKRKLSEDDLVNPLGTAMNKQMPASSVGHLASNSTILKKNEKKSFQKGPSQFASQVSKTSAVFLMNVKVIPNKAKRYDKDKRTKFNLETVSKDYFIKLKDQCKGLFTEDFSKKIYSDDFRKQVEAFKEMKSQIDKKINIPIYFDNLDLILKIIGIKIMNNLNPTLMKNFFELLDSLYLVLFENKYKLNETESSIIINILIDKLSLNNNTLRENLFSLLNKYIELMDTNKIMVNVINIALNKNNKIKTDILDLIIDLTKNKKLNISTKTYTKLLCKFLPINDNTIRNKTLILFQEIYSNIKNELWNMIEVSEKDKQFLEENLCLENDEEEEEEEENKNEEESGNDIENNDKTNNNNQDINNDLENQKGTFTKEELINILNKLYLEDENEKNNIIIIIHEILCGKFNEYKNILISNVDIIITTFKNVSHKLFFVKDLKTIPIKFAKYLAIILCKLASNKEFISNLSYEVLLDIIRDLLKYLLINDLDKIGDNQEGSIMLKSLNSTMLRIIENCNLNLVISSLLELIKEFHDEDNQNLINLAIKCLLKALNNLTDTIPIDKILYQIHLLLLDLKDSSKKKHNSDETTNIALEKVVRILVKQKKEKILIDYTKSVENYGMNDKYLLEMIKDALKKK